MWQITRREFKKLLHYLVYFNDLWHEFEAIDEDGDRRLSLEEFGHVSAVVGHPMSAEEAEAEFEAMDEDGGGFVLFDEFCRWCAHRHLGEDFAAADEHRVDMSAQYHVPDPSSPSADRSPREIKSAGNILQLVAEQEALVVALQQRAVEAGGKLGTDALAQLDHAGRRIAEVRAPAPAPCIIRCLSDLTAVFPCSSQAFCEI